MRPLATDVDLARLMPGLTVADVHAKVAAGVWPCVRPKRSVWLFTQAQVEEIQRIESRGPVKREATTSSLPRPTARSQARRRAS